MTGLSKSDAGLVQRLETLVRQWPDDIRDALTTARFLSEHRNLEKAAEEFLTIFRDELGKAKLFEKSTEILRSRFFMSPGIQRGRDFHDVLAQFLGLFVVEMETGPPRHELDTKAADTLFHLCIEHIKGGEGFAVLWPVLRKLSLQRDFDDRDKVKILQAMHRMIEEDVGNSINQTRHILIHAYFLVQVSCSFSEAFEGLLAVSFMGRNWALIDTNLSLISLGIKRMQERKDSKIVKEVRLSYAPVDRQTKPMSKPLS